MASKETVKIIRLDDDLYKSIINIQRQLKETNRSTSENDVVKMCIMFGLGELKGKILEGEIDKKYLMNMKRHKKLPSCEEIIKYFELLKTNNYVKVCEEMNITRNIGVRILNFLKLNNFIETKRGIKTKFLVEKITIEEIKKIGIDI